MEIKHFITICKLNKDSLKRVLFETLSDVYPEGSVISEDGYIYAKGNVPVLITAHMDTVHKTQCKKIHNKKKGVLTSPQGIGGDDRCGIYMTLAIVEQMSVRGEKPYILFCEDEEIGGIGSNKFVNSKHIDDLKEMLFLIELDRANANDLVFYDDDNQDFHRWCEKVTGYKETWGSFSDISHLCPACGVSGVNISCGYYKAHTTDEYVVVREMERSIDVTIDLINMGLREGKQYEYKEIEYKWDDFYFGKKGGYDRYIYGDYDYCEFQFVDKKGKVYEGYGMSYIEAVGTMLMENPDMKFSDFVDSYQIA